MVYSKKMQSKLSFVICPSFWSGVSLILFIRFKLLTESDCKQDRTSRALGISFWQNFRHWLHRKFSKWQLPTQSGKKIPAFHRQKFGISNSYHTILYYFCNIFYFQDTLLRKALPSRIARLTQVTQKTESYGAPRSLALESGCLKSIQACECSGHKWNSVSVDKPANIPFP